MLHNYESSSFFIATTCLFDLYQPILSPFMCNWILLTAIMTGAEILSKSKSIFWLCLLKHTKIIRYTFC